MTSTCIHQVALECTAGSADKLYVIHVIESVGPAGTTYTTAGFYGGRGQALKRDEKYSGPSRASAIAEANKVEKEKRRKYVDHSVAPGAPVRGMPSGIPVFGAPAPAGATPAGAAPAGPVGMLPMHATALADSELESMICNPDAVFQRKYGGDRAVISLRRGAIVHTNSLGKVKPLPAPVEAELKKLLAQTDFRDELETVLDGNLEDDVFVAFDMLVLRDTDIRERSFDERYADLEVLLGNNQGLLAESAYSEAEKRAMVKKAQTEKWDSLIIRLGSAEYKAGRSKALLECNLWATCTCRVLTSNSASRTIQVALRDATDEEVFCASIVVPVHQAIPEPDSLVEVRYLHVTAAGLLADASLLMLREDVDECDTRENLRQAPTDAEKEEALSPAI